MKTNWIITKTSTREEDSDEIYKFNGTADEMQEKLSAFAKHGVIIENSDGEEDYSISHDVLGDGNYSISVWDSYGENEEIYSAKAIDSIDEMPDLDI